MKYCLGLPLLGLMTCQSAYAGWGQLYPTYQENSSWYDESRNTYEYLPEDRGFAYNSPLDQAVAGKVSQMWARLDYLHWEIGPPEDGLLGESVSGIDSVTNQFIQRADVPFTGIDRNTGSTQSTIVTNIGEVSLKNTSGLRGTLGMPLGAGELEAQVWSLMKADQTINQATAYAQGNLVGTSVLLNGVNTNRIITYDTSFEALYETVMMGSEINYIWEDKRPYYGAHLRPILGIKYVRFDELLRQVGVDNSTGTTRTTTIETKGNNDIFGPQIGARAELVHEWFTLGVEPKFAFSFNRYKAQLKTDQLYDIADTPSNTDIERSVWAPMFTLAAYAKVNINHRFFLYVGYDLLWNGGISRPYDNIQYNDDASNTSRFLPTRDVTDVITQGLSVGGEFRF